jgi:hypothetical protein
MHTSDPLHPLPVLLFAAWMQLLPSHAYLHLPASDFATKFVTGNNNKVRRQPM